jgi:cytochrome P450
MNAIKQIYTLRYMRAFYWLDVRPAIAARRKQPQDDLISYLIAQGYDDQAILTECVTYAAAGMVTTREFIVMAAWHMLDHPELRARYLAAGWEEREAILHETLRIEPVVGHLYRRATADLTVTSAGQTHTIAKGDLINISVEDANLDRRVVEGDPQDLCPARPLHAERAGAMLMSFGDGTHRCPGAYLAIQESDIFLQRLLRVPGLRLERAPDVTWNELTAGYEVRRCLIAATPA